MRNFKKVLLCVILFVTVTAVLSTALIEPFYHSEYMYFCDAKARQELAGTLDYLFVGASNGYAAFVPSVADEAMDVCSYNLSGGLLTWYGRKTILEKELSRNPVKTVVFEISFNSLWREYHSAWGDSVFLSRLDSPGERLSFVLRHTSVKDWGEMYANLLGNSIDYLKAVVQNKCFGKDLPLSNVDYSAKGFHAKYESLQVTQDQINQAPSNMDTYFVKKNVDDLYDMINMCKEKNIEVLFAVVPISDYLIHQFDNWYEMEEKLRVLSEDTGCPIIDFNLLKNRYSLFNDAGSFADDVHMSKTGAEVFTAEYAKVMNKYNRGEDISNLFYSDYASMKADSPYA
ncbi:MAG: hypothetical protein K5756_08145 [Clostridiales bacterium]|nr:hypothetical protein [Clostridiales bacterium]